MSKIVCSIVKIFFTTLIMIVMIHDYKTKKSNFYNKKKGVKFDLLIERNLIKKCHHQYFVTNNNNFPFPPKFLQTNNNKKHKDKIIIFHFYQNKNHKVNPFYIEFSNLFQILICV